MKASNECLYPTDVFLISCGMGCKRITVTDIAYIEAMKDNCIIHMVDGKRYTQSCPMGDIEPELNPDMFKRIHRSFIVNISYMRVCRNDASSFCINKAPTFPSQGFVMSKRICIFRH